MGQDKNLWDAGRLAQRTGILEWTLNEIMDRMHTNIYVNDIDTGEVLFMNKTLSRSFGVERIEGKRCWELFQSGMNERCSFCPVNYLDRDDPEHSFYIWEEHNTRNGRIYKNYDSLIYWVDGRLVHFQHSVDVTEEYKRSQAAAMDDLTGALNRRAGKTLLQDRLDANGTFALCMLDVNDLKVTNDAYGHQAGDALLVSVVDAVREQLMPDDCMFRMSGDEFAVLMEGADRKEAERRLQNALTALDGRECREAFCYGIAEVRQGTRRTASGALNEADMDLYTHKRQLHIQRAMEKLQEMPAGCNGTGNFSYDESLLYDALVQSTDDYLYVCNMKTGVFRYPRVMVEEFELPGQVVENAAAVWGARVHENDKAAFLEANQDIVEGRTASHCVEYRARNRRGEWVWMRCRGHLERDQNGEPALFAGFITNLGQKNKIDHLTGFFNKVAFEEECSRLLEREHFCLMLFGIDDLKRVNGLYDREFGDEVIRIVSQRIQSLLPPNAQIFRMDGDEFAVLIRGGDRSIAQSLFYSVQEAFSTQQIYDDKKFFCTLSCGSVFSPQDGADYQELIKRATCALESAKRGGKDRMEMFDPAMLSRMERKLALTQKLRESIGLDFSGFGLCYQPVFDSARRMVGAEALCRWSCKAYGAVPPEEFIGLLEDSGLILPVGRWVFQTAVKQCAAFQRRMRDFVIHVNLSRMQFEDPSLGSFLLDTVKREGIRPQDVILELTETCLSEDLKHLTGILQRLREMGFRIAIDDFGTGYSSLSLLKQAPIDIVKLDRSFVSGIQKNDFDLAFIRLATELCHIVDIHVCLEGVEAEEEYAAVHPLGIDHLQGYLLGRPCSSDAFWKRFLT